MLPETSVLTACIAKNGSLPRPILMNRAGQTRSGADLQEHVVDDDPRMASSVRVMSDLDAAILHLAAGGQSVLETADLMHVVKEALLQGDRRWGSGRTATRVSTWIADNIHRVKGFSPRQVNWYLKLACASDEERQRVQGVQSLNEAVHLLGWAKQRRSIPSRTSVEDLPLVEMATLMLERVEGASAVEPGARQITLKLLQMAVDALVTQRAAGPT